MDEDQVTTETASSEGPIQEQVAEETQTPASSAGAATETPAPVDYEKKYNELLERSKKSVDTHSELMAQLQMQGAELRRYKAAEERNLMAIQANQETWVDNLADPQKAPDLIRQIVNEHLQGYNAQAQAINQYTESQKALGQLYNYAVNDAGMTEDEFSEFVVKNKDKDGYLFGSYSPNVALDMAKRLIREQRAPQTTAKIREDADKDADEKAKLKLKSQLPSGSATGVVKDNRTANEKFRDYIKQVDGGSVNDWLSH